ncbi:sulfotransferase family 2 domain-containing protein [Shimia sp. SDUM112013]|uniref:sulfotransferase family 2 domain-containing protein n=1 Tax=Shimia sp. SDUM112013 TaxID=3136160 RepID=UPI0032EAF8E1
MPVYVIDHAFLLFSHIPKCGGTSVEKTLRRHGQEFLFDRGFHGDPLGFTRCSVQHLHRSAIDRIFPADMFRYEFAIVRDPFRRIESEFKFRMGLKERSRRNTRPPELDSEPSVFADWLRFAFDHYAAHPFLFDNHLRPQQEFIGEKTQVFRLEDGLGSVFARLSEVTGRKIAEPALRFQKSKDLVVAWTDQDRALVRDFYAGDFEQFGYSG